MSIASPTPWHYEVHQLSTGYSAIVYDAGGYRVGTGHLTEEDARLIAAAPDLLAVAQELAEFFEWTAEFFEWTDALIGVRARAAIAKATGAP